MRVSHSSAQDENNGVFKLPPEMPIQDTFQGSKVNTKCVCVHELRILDTLMSSGCGRDGPATFKHRRPDSYCVPSKLLPVGVLVKQGF